MHQFLCSSVCFHIFHNPMVLGHTTSLEQRTEPTTPLKTHLWHLMTPPRTPFVTAPSSIPWWPVLSCDPDLFRHHFSFYFYIHFYCAAWTIVTGMVSSSMTTIVFNLNLKFHLFRSVSSFWGSQASIVFFASGWSSIWIEELDYDYSAMIRYHMYNTL